MPTQQCIKELCLRAYCCQAVAHAYITMINNMHMSIHNRQEMMLTYPLLVLTPFSQCCLKACIYNQNNLGLVFMHMYNASHNKTTEHF